MGNEASSRLPWQPISPQMPTIHLSTCIHFILKLSQSNKLNFKLFKVHPTRSSISVTLIMKLPRYYRGTEKGQKVVYSHMVVDARSNRNGTFDHTIDLFYSH